MKRLQLIIIYCFIGSVVFAQQEPHFSQYNYNKILYNPAAAGESDNHEIRLVNRFQWVNFPEAPKTYGLTYSGGIKRIGLGASLVYDLVGPTLQYGGKLAFSYYLFRTEDLKLSIGLEGRIMHFQVDVDRIDFAVDNDPAIFEARDGTTSGDASAGVFLDWKNLYVGYSALNLIQADLDVGTSPEIRDPIAQLYRHHYLIAGYHWKGKHVGVEPSLMVKTTENTDPQIQGGVNFHFLDDQLSAGFSYRNPGFLSFLLKVTFDKQFPILFSFDIATGKFQDYVGSSNEISLGANFLRKEFKVKE
ncbi:MAG: PorP/SprF family type IX secretion system membrane protein [Bacteroidota bacterium]